MPVNAHSISWPVPIPRSRVGPASLPRLLPASAHGKSVHSPQYPSLLAAQLLGCAPVQSPPAVLGSPVPRPSQPPARRDQLARLWSRLRSWLSNFLLPILLIPDLLANLLIQFTSLLNVRFLELFMSTKWQARTLRHFREVWIISVS